MGYVAKFSLSYASASVMLDLNQEGIFSMKMVIPNAQEIRKFLKGNYYALDVVIESERIIKSIFGEVPLEMQFSPHSSAIFVHIKYEGNDVIEKMDKFDRWFLKKQKKLKEQLNFIVT